MSPNSKIYRGIFPFKLIEKLPGPLSLTNQFVTCIRGRLKEEIGTLFMKKSCNSLPQIALI